MSTIAANSGSGSGAVAAAGPFAASRVYVRVAIAIAGAGAAASVLVATSGHLVDPVAYGLQVAVIVVGTAAVALVWAVARPGNRIVVILLAYAGAIAGVSLQGAANPLLHSVGVLFEMPAFLLGYYLIFAFPEGRLARPLEKVLFAGTAWTMLAAFLPFFFFSPVVSGAAPLAGCNARCPTNALMIADEPSIAHGFGSTEEYVGVLVAIAIVGGLSYRLVTASRPRRRALLPVYVPALLLTVPFGIFHADTAGLFTLDPGWHDAVGWLLTVGRATLTFGFLLAIALAVLFAGAALKRILSRLDRREDAAYLRDLVAQALDDPQLELAFEVDRGNAVFADAHGTAIDPTSAGAGRSATSLRHDGEIVAYILHDEALETDPELVQAAGQAVLLALENGRLAEELQSKTEELRASRARIVATVERERLRLERDLHDGAQQRLMSIQVKLALAQQQPADHIADRLEEISLDAAAAAEELRALAHGIYPTVLLERGLPDALRSFAATATIPVRVADCGIGRCPGTVESAVYFCALEAVQNTTKHAGAGARVSITLGRQNGEIQFAIADDGIGMNTAASADCVGLSSMRDRIGAVGGELEFVSSGRGTAVIGRIPSSQAESRGTRKAMD